MNPRRDGLTGELFADIPEPARPEPETMDYRPAVAELIRQMLDDAKRRGIDRWEVAARMSRYSGVDTSKGLLDSYTANSREASNCPLWKAPVMEFACDSRLLVEWHASLHGGRILWGREVMDAEVGRRQRELDRLKEELRAVRELQRKVR